MRILLSGGSGFVGSNFAVQAAAAGHEVLSFSRRKLPSSPNWHHVTASCATLPWEAIERFQPEALVHTAWEATPGVYLESPENHDWVTWSEQAIRGLADRGTTHFLVLGTCIEYRITGQPLREDEPPAPESTYARCKDELHRRLTAPSTSPPLPLAWARLFYPYGPGEHPSRLASSLIARLRRSEPVVLNTPFSIKDYIYVDDVASALLRLLERRFHGVINLGTGQGVSVLTLAQTIAEIMGRPELVRWADPPAADSLYHVVADSSRLRSLGWFPQVGLEAGLRRLIDASA